MKELLNSKDIQDFLNDVRINSETDILEEGKEKDEIIEIAFAKGIILKDSRDLAGFKTIYTFANKANKNKARLPKEALLKALPTMIGKPVDIDHLRNYVIGHYIDYRYAQKEDMVIAYGVFYKSNFKKEWEKAKSLFRAKKLTTSYEIWCPKDKRKKKEDGTFDLLEQEIAGGALLFSEKPAFEDAKVLEFAKQNIENIEDEMIYASKYTDEELLTSQEVDLDNTKKEDTNKENNQNKIITCSNCKESIDLMTITELAQGTIKCPKCFAVLNGQTGEMIYPPQIIDFKLLCPECHCGNWLLLKNSSESVEIKCKSCAKEYIISFIKVESSDLLKNVSFFYSNRVGCLQCGTRVDVFGISSMKTKNVKCPKCGLSFSYDIAHEHLRKISSILKKADSVIMKSSAEGEENIMESNEQKKIEDIQKENTIVPESVVETTNTPTVEITNSSEVSATQTASSSEVVVSPTIETPKVEETKAEEIKKETPEVVEAKKEETVEEDEYETDFEISKKLTYEQKQSLSDNDFAVVVEKDGKKIRKYPIQDKAHVRNALARLGNAKNKAELEKLGVNVETVINKIKAKAKEMGIQTEESSLNADEVISALPSEVTKMMKELMKDGMPIKEAMKKAWEQYKKSVKTSATCRKLVTKKIKNLKKASKELTKEKAKLEADLKKASEEKELYKKKAKTLIERRAELGEASQLTDDELLNDDKFERAKVELENAKLKAQISSSSDIVSEHSERSSKWFADKRKEIDDLAFRNTNKK